MHKGFDLHCDVIYPCTNGKEILFMKTDLSIANLEITRGKEVTNCHLKHDWSVLHLIQRRNRDRSIRGNELGKIYVKSWLK